MRKVTHKKQVDNLGKKIRYVGEISPYDLREGIITAETYNEDPRKHKVTVKVTSRRTQEEKTEERFLNKVHFNF